MPTIGGTRALYGAQRQFKQALNAYLKDVAQYAMGIIMGASDAQGLIDPARLASIKREIGQRIEAVFVPVGTRQGLAPDGRPLAPYGALLMHWIGYAVLSIVDAHATFILRAVPDDLQRWLQSSPQAESLAEASNPLASYEAPHVWVDANGYQLSERIWKAGLQTQLKIDALLSDGIRNGISARDLAKQLEQFLLPNRAALRTKRPYGSDGSIDAMRLARSEISRAHGQASKIAAITNPFVSGIDWALSAQHPRFDICDGLATIGMDGERIRDPYPPESAPVVVQDSHPQCLCHNSPFVASSRSEIVDDLRAQMGTGNRAPMTPLNTREMLQKLLGAYLASEMLRSFVNT